MTLICSIAGEHQCLAAKGSGCIEHMLPPAAYIQAYGLAVFRKTVDRAVILEHCMHFGLSFRGLFQVCQGLH